MLVFAKGGKPENLEKTLEADKRTNTNSTHLRRRVRESNLGHIGERRVQSQQRHPCFPHNLLLVHRLIYVPCTLDQAFKLLVGSWPLLEPSTKCNRNLLQTPLCLF